MNEYISKEYIRNIALKRWSDACGAESYAYSRVLDDIAEAPTIEVVHGQWELYPSSMHRRCSVCKIEHEKPKFNVRANYCPNCGATMDLKGE